MGDSRADRADKVSEESNSPRVSMSSRIPPVVFSEIQSVESGKLHKHIWQFFGFSREEDTGEGSSLYERAFLPLTRSPIRSLLRIR